MAISENELPPFLKRNATAEESTHRDLEWILLELLANKHDGILGLRLVEVGGDNDVVHLLITPDCQRSALGQVLEIPELKTVKRHKAAEEPGHYIAILASLLEQTVWWREQMAARIRAGYLKKRREFTHGDMTRNLTAEEHAEIAAITGKTALPSPVRSKDRALGGSSLSTREMKEAVMDWLRERNFHLITPEMVGIGRVSGNPQKWAEITLSAKYAAPTLVRRLKSELEKAGAPAEPINVNTALVFRFPWSVVDQSDD